MIPTEVKAKVRKEVGQGVLAERDRLMASLRMSEQDAGRLVDELNKKIASIESFEVKVFYAPPGQGDSTNQTNDVTGDSVSISISEAGQYIAWATYYCRSISREPGSIGRYPHESFFKNNEEISNRYNKKNCSSSFDTQEDSKTSHPIAVQLKEGDVLKFSVYGWTTNFYNRAELFAIKIAP
ncbi:MAG: hypothetical protein F6K10_02730 [Moorea sp. SIO2B7]|nr:hypothetical protein [Moorena sp. SIO2B7]